MPGPRWRPELPPTPSHYREHAGDLAAALVSLLDLTMCWDRSPNCELCATRRIAHRAVTRYIALLRLEPQVPVADETVH